MFITYYNYNNKHTFLSSLMIIHKFIVYFTRQILERSIF